MWNGLKIMPRQTFDTPWAQAKGGADQLIVQKVFVAVGGGKLSAILCQQESGLIHLIHA